MKKLMGIPLLILLGCADYECVKEETYTYQKEITRTQMYTAFPFDGLPKTFPRQVGTGQFVTMEGTKCVEWKEVE